MSATYQGQTHDAYDERARSFPEDLSPDFLFDIFAAWRSFDDQIDQINAKKKAVIENVRCCYGKHHAKAIKAAMAIMRKDLRERTEELKCNELAAHYVDLIESELDARNLYA